MNEVLAVILGGGRGERLYPLTKHRAKPALPLAGKYRLIDIPVSNCINSGILKIYVLTQFNSASLIQHIADSYHFYPFMKGFVDVLAAQHTPQSSDWFQGTADAVRKTLWVMEPWHVRDYMILSGDHLYRMDYKLFIEHHRKTDADITISVIPVHEKDASHFGLMRSDNQGRVVEFREKPTGDSLRAMRVDTTRYGLPGDQASEAPYLASMGIYAFKHQVLLELLKKDEAQTDFGKHIIPSALGSSNVQAYAFHGYWEDIGTIESFYRANLALVKQPRPDFSFYNAESPIYTRARYLPPSKILHTELIETMVCDGCIIKGSRISNSVIGISMRVEENCIIENTLLMGADYHQSDQERDADLAAGRPPVGIGMNSVIRNAIIDKNARIGRNVQIINKGNLQNVERESQGYWIKSGIVVVMKDSTIPDNTIV